MTTTDIVHFLKWLSGGICTLINGMYAMSSIVGGRSSTENPFGKKNLILRTARCQMGSVSDGCQMGSVSDGIEKMMSSLKWKFCL